MTEPDRLGPPPVEPLSDVAWSRVERGLWARMDAEPAPAPARTAPPPRRWIWIAAPALAAAAAVIAVIALGTGEDRAPAAATARLVSQEAPTSLSLGDVHVMLDAHSAVVMDRERNAVLERGGAAFAIAPRGERPPFVVTAGDTVVRVVGTRFHVARSGERAQVSVEHGIVDVVFRGATKRVSAGEQWSSQAPTVVTAVRTAQAEPVEPPAEPAVVPPAPDAAEPPVDEPAPAPPPAPTPPPAAKRTPVPPPAAKPAPAPTPAPPLAPAPAPAPAPPVAAKPVVDRDQERFRQLEALEARNPRAAIEGYLELSHNNSRWAEHALFAAARLSADRKEPRAKQLLDSYLQRFPRGANAADARTLRGHL